MGVFQFERTQIIPADLTTVWQFISRPANLKRITPNYMGFSITNEPIPRDIYSGLIISYRVKPLLGISTPWTTEITHMSEHKYFVDEQRSGPYRMWHHEHHIQQTDSGILMRDIVTYQPPLGIIGNLMNHLFIQRKLREIFDYREKALEEIFGKPAE